MQGYKNFEIGKQYMVNKNAEEGLAMYNRYGDADSYLLKCGEILTLQIDNADKDAFMLVRTNGDMSDTIYRDQIYLYIEEIIEKPSEEKLQETEAEDTKVDNDKVVNEEQINYKDSYERLMEMYKKLQQENEDLKKALVKIALKL